MSAPLTECMLKLIDEEYTLHDYQSDIPPRWCTGS